MQTFTRRALSLMLLATLAACSSSPRNITDKSLKPIPLGYVADKNLTITAADGSFELKAGQQFSSPFQADIWTSHLPQLADARIVEGFATGRASGGRNVMVKVAGQEQPLYGVLVLSPVYGAAEGPGARSYQITVPADKIQAAYAGRTAVAYENVKWQERWSNGAARDYHWRSWILWLSLTPL